MDQTEAVPDEIAASLRRYVQIQQEEQRLREEKAALQEILGRFMTQRQLSFWYPSVEGQALKVRRHETTVIEYDEPLLKERLGSRFGSILAPDIRKIRRSLAQISPLLSPVLGMIGSPAPDKVRAAVEQGTIKKEEFAGAFKKTVKLTVAVMKAGPGGETTSESEPNS